MKALCLLVVVLFLQLPCAAQNRQLLTTEEEVQ